MNKLKFALIGCGRISANHIKALIDNYQDAELVALCDIINDKAELKADEYILKAREKNLSVKRPKIFNDYKKMLLEEDLDVCSICTELGYHAKIALNCIAFKKHI